MSNWTEKNENRKNHKGGDRQHVTARAFRRLLGGAFGNPQVSDFPAWGWNDLIVGTSGRERKGGDSK